VLAPRLHVEQEIVVHNRGAVAQIGHRGVVGEHLGQAGCGEGVRVMAGAVHRDWADHGELAVEGGCDLQVHAWVSGPGGDGGSTGSGGLGGPAGDQLAVPAQDGGRGDEQTEASADR